MTVLNSFGILGGLFMLFYGYDIILQINALYTEYYWSSVVFGGREFETALMNILLNGSFYYILISIFYGILYGVNIKKIPVKANRVLSYIGIAFSSVTFLLSIFIIAIYGNIYFSMIYWSWMAYGLFMFVFSIILLVIAVKYFRGPRDFAEDDEVLFQVETDFDIE